eukprot:gene7453-biopygen5050
MAPAAVRTVVLRRSGEARRSIGGPLIGTPSADATTVSSRGAGDEKKHSAAGSGCLKPSWSSKLQAARHVLSAAALRGPSGAHPLGLLLPDPTAVLSSLLMRCLAASGAEAM